MTGGTLLDNSTGLLVSATDAAPAAYTFDTFHFRPSSATTTATSFDTNSFKVEFVPVPEPAAAGLIAIAAILCFRRRRA